MLCMMKHSPCTKLHVVHWQRKKINNKHNLLRGCSRALTQTHHHTSLPACTLWLRCLPAKGQDNSLLMTKSVCYRPWSDSLGRSTYTGCRGEVILAWERDAFFVETWPEKTCLGPKEQLGELLSHKFSPTVTLTLWLDCFFFINSGV